MMDGGSGGVGEATRRGAWGLVAVIVAAAFAYGCRTHMRERRRLGTSLVGGPEAGPLRSAWR